jgi:hypothetical protein
MIIFKISLDPILFLDLAPFPVKQIISDPDPQHSLLPEV